MIVKSKNRIPILATDREVVYPVLPLMTGVLFPGTMITIQVGRAENLALLEKCNGSKSQFVVSHSHSEFERAESPPVHQVGVFAEITYIRD